MDNYSSILGRQHPAEETYQVNFQGLNRMKTEPSIFVHGARTLFNCRFPRLVAKYKFFWKTTQPRTPWRCHGSVKCGEAEQVKEKIPKVGTAIILALVLGLKASMVPSSPLRSPQWQEHGWTRFILSSGRAAVDLWSPKVLCFMV